MTEKIIISKKLNEWLEDHQTLDIDDTLYSKRFGRGIFNELIDEVWFKISDIECCCDILAVFGLKNSNSKVAHLWLLLNRDKWEVAKDELFYICIPEPGNVNAWLTKGGGFQYSSKPPYKERYKWTQEEIEKHEVAKYLQHFKKKVEK
ncbi:hypothetical protein 57001_27 [Lactococcus phage 57001]|uniref:Uncharacterized protein n=1 Tax=Lactococcus phage 57001 TaxID=2029667 RepID=A0A343JPU2_9CAUD|nr:hypothetical protein HYP33_gp27 [Lactococcus phage 57001]ASZ71515.1 hypothetical protein 57001_27 [Lactococcus phage 57001]